MNQGTLLDLHGPTNGPLNGTCEADFRGPLPKKNCPPGSILINFLDRPLDNGKTFIYSLFEVNPTFSSREIDRIDSRLANCPPPLPLRADWGLNLLQISLFPRMSALVSFFSLKRLKILFIFISLIKSGICSNFIPLYVHCRLRTK